MSISIKNINWLRGINMEDPPSDFGSKMAELVQDIGAQLSNIAQQGNFNPNGPATPPPQLNSLNVTASNGHFQVAIDHSGAEFYRGIGYHVEHADNPQFNNPHPVDLGAARNANLFLGNATRYFRAAPAYGSSPPGPWTYHGSASAPIAVAGGGTVPGPTFSTGQGSGTGTAGEGLQGPGQRAFRGANPPIR